MSTERRPRVRRAEQDSWNHGTLYAYKKIGCRCADCVGAWRRYLERQARYREQRRGGRPKEKRVTGVVRRVSTVRPAECRCGPDAIGTEDCLKCGKPIPRCSAA